MIATATICVLFVVEGVASFQERVPLGFGTESSINLYPGRVDTNDWGGVDTVLIQDLDDNALYQHFSGRNSAYLRPDMELRPNEKVRQERGNTAPANDESEAPVETEVPSVATTTADGSSDAESQESDTATGSDETSPDYQVDEPSTTTEPTPTETTREVETGTEPEAESELPVEEESSDIETESAEGSDPIEVESGSASEPEPETSDDPAADESAVSFGTSGMFTSPFLVAKQVFPFAQESTTTAVSTELVPEEVVSEPTEPESSGSEVNELEEETELENEVSAQTQSNQDRPTSSAGVVAGASTSTEGEAGPDESTTDTEESASVPEEEALNTTDEVDQIPEPQSAEIGTTSTSAMEDTYDITLGGFATPDLESGEFITGMQLRLSLAGQLDEPIGSGTAPYVEVLFGEAGSEESIGSIVIGDEVSNALNGGFYLFALPQYESLASLSEASIIVRYHGDREELDGLYLDAVWIEVDTKLITRDDLLSRGSAEKLKHLKRPERAELVSQRTNFGRFEAPVFNLRYQSQRNAVVRGVRSLLGRGLVAVHSVSVEHRSLGPSGIVPKLTTTDDGLVTVQFDEESLERMRPGQYTIEVVYDEGGYVVRDTFDFQWGILSINPNKSEYQSGETADVSIGALTPNGHTICHADLGLYVVEPDGFISRVAVRESGQCDGNNVIDVPDFSALVPTTLPGEYELYLERLEDGRVVSYTSDTFLVVENQDLSIERVGPTRIYPPAPYPMELTIRAGVNAFDGELVERVPASFKIASTSATISRDGEWQVLTWDIDLLPGGERTVGYSFDAPDLSPYLYELGPAELQSDSYVAPVVTATTSSRSASSSSSATTTASTPTGGVVFAEHRQWQIASDAVGNMILFWDDGASIPTGWTCLSCGSGTFFQNFVRGSSTYNSTGGVTTHTHATLSSSVANTTSGILVEFQSGTTLAANTHAHTASLSQGSGSNLPRYRELRVIQYTDAAGEPTTIPQDAIAIFDSTVPSGWTRYSAQDGYYIYGGNSPGTISGSNTHSHTVTGTLNASTGAIGRRGGQAQAQGINTGHTHSVSGNSATANNEPEYIEVILGQIDANGSPVNGMISMWTEDVANGWNDVSSDPASDFSNRFIKPAATYGTTGGASTHSHASANITSGSAAGGTTGGRSGGASDGVAASHTHVVSVSTSDDAHLPPYLTAVFGKRIGLDATFSQLSYRWYVNENAEPPTDPWDDDSIDLTEREPITATSTPVRDGDVVRLRMSALVNNATATAGTAFQLQFATTTTVCSSATGWADVGQTGSSTVWRGYDNASVSDHATLSSTTLASSTNFFTYEENGYATGTPSDIGADRVGEWDFVLQNNGAAAGANYCFRLVDDTDATLFAYQSYPRLFTNEAPAAPTLTAPFDNEKTASTTPLFEFSTTDFEGEDIHYEVEIDTDTTFSSPIVDRNTISHEDDFLNLANGAAKPAYNSGDLIQFTPPTSFASGTTYYWRVRGQDPDGSDQWGDWSTPYSFTIDPNLVAAAWFQTEDEQFDTNTNVGVETGGNSLSFISGSTTGTSTSGAITFSDGTLGTAWDSLRFTDSGSITYYVEYQDGDDEWQRIPNADLSGNSSGFTSGPVSLLTLDTDTYAVLRLVAVFTNAVSPTLNDWEVRWGYRVETPSITALFPNEQVGTTTPTFTFSTTDPQSDDLTYQIEWSTDNTFTAATTRTSDTDGGFTDSTAATTDPFDSGNTINFTIEPADALTGTTTYWWRVRAKDTTGANAYSFWSDPRSFTVIPETEVSTWYQTSEEQFDSDILSGTAAIGSGAVAVATTATEAMIVYGEGVETIPRYRLWDGAAWDSEGELSNIDSTLRFAVVRAGTTREEYVAGTLGNDADLNLHVYSTGAWASPTEFTTSAGVNSSRGFDIAYETISGDAMVVYCDGDANPSYRMWDGASWSSAAAITSSLSDDCRWVELASDPNSNELALIIRGVSGDPYQVFIWNAGTSSWGNSSTFGAARNSTYSGQSIMYESQSGDIIAVAPSPGGGPNRFVYNAWNGATWSGGTTQTIAGRLYWAELAQDPLSDELIMCYQNEDSEVQAITWSGTAWGSDTQLSATVNADTDPGFACVYDIDNDAVGVYGDGTNVDYRLWNGSAWGGASALNSLNTIDTADVIRTGDDTVLGAFFDGGANDSLEFASWNGSAWSSTVTLESDMSVDSSPFGQPFFMAPRNANTEGTTIVSPGIDFDDGLGPYWDTFSWTDTTPGTSEILYSMQYQTATGSWAFIPDSELAGNEAGVTAGPIDLSGLNTNTYNVLRPYAQLSCDGGGNCPELSDWRVTWAGGITVSGTIDAYDQTTPVTAGTVRVAVNGVDFGDVGSIDGSGNWFISNVTAFAGDVLTVYVDTTTVSDQAVAVTRYSGQGNITGVELFEQHITIGTGAATTTPYINTDVGGYDNGDNGTDIFYSLSGSTLDTCVYAGCGTARIYIAPGATYAPGGRLVTHDLENNGTFTSGSFTHELSGSWDNNGTTTMTGSTILMSATSTSESIDSTGAVSGSFNNLTFGTTTGSGTWTLASTLDVNGALTVSRGTLARGTTPISVASTLTTGVNGFWTGIGTTTFDGASAANWRDQNATLQNVGNVVVDGANKIVSLTGNVAANNLRIAANDTLDVSASHYDITLYGSWVNLNNFLPRNGGVFFAATAGSQTITAGGDAFHDLTFSGVGGAWSFTEPVVTVNNDLTVATGTVTLPSNGTTTIAGSFDATGGTFQHSNGTLNFTGSGAETITFDGEAFTNVARNMTFNGGGSWAITDTHATATADVRIEQGAVTLPGGTFAIGGRLVDSGGSFIGNGGTARFYSSGSETLTAGGSTFSNITFDGTGDWTFSDTNVSAGGDLAVLSGSLTMPSGTFTLGGSYDNQATVTSGTGEVLFNSTDSGETVNFGSSDLYDVTFDNTTGGWTLTGNASTSNDLTLTAASDWTLGSGLALAVGGAFTNSVGGASTTWTGSTLSLEAGDYSINTASDAGDAYETLRIKADTDVKAWNSVAATYVVNSTGSFYSQDHNAADGDLYIFGNYTRTSGTEYWSYLTDFDGVDLGTSSARQVDVRFAAGASANLSNSTFDITGDPVASTTIENQGSGAYTVSATGGTTTAQYYEFDDLGGSGLSLLGGTIVPTLRDGSYAVTAGGGSALTLSSTTIDANPGKQIYNITFATTTAIAASNVTQSDGTPVSFWWFREGQGNLYGEQFDNDTGDPGSVRFDDSSLSITVSGTVYSDEGITPGGLDTCQLFTTPVRLVVDGVTTYDVGCSFADGTYSIPNVTIVGDPVLTLYFNDQAGGEQAIAITKTPTGDVTDLDLYENRIIVRHEDVDPITISDMAIYDWSDDTDIGFLATGTPTGLIVNSEFELHVWDSKTFAPESWIEVRGNGSGVEPEDGSLHIDDNATFTGNGSSTYSIGGNFIVDSGATFEPASSTVFLNATTTGKAISSPAEVTFNELSFTGVGGGWNLNADVRVREDITITTGTVTGTGDITIVNGSLSGNGVLSLGSPSVTTLERSNTLGGTSAWTFHDLVLGNGSVVGTTTPVFVATTTVSGTLTVANAHFLAAGATEWDLSGTGTVFTETGTFLEDTSTIRYSGNGADVLPTQYYNLDLNAGAGTPTYTATGAGLIVSNDLTVGGDAGSTFDLNTNDPTFDVDGNVLIRSNGTLLASDSSSFTITGDYDNNGTFTGNGGTLTFDSNGTSNIAAGQSSFSSVVIDGTGDFTVSEDATSTADFTLTDHNSFTVSSGEALAVGDTFINTLGGGATTWTGSTLRLFSDTLYTANTKTVSDTYGTLDIEGTTQVKLWNSNATSYDVESTAALYSQDHADVAGDLAIYGTYRGGGESDLWNYARDFDGTALGGSSREVDVFFATSAAAIITDGSLAVVGSAGASTTLQSFSGQTYSMRVGGTASTSWQYYAVRDIDSAGLSFSGTPAIAELSYGDLEVSQNGGTAMTVGGTVITANPAQNYTNNRFALSGVGSGFNVTATGTSVSSWRFTNHIGDIDGEAFDVDPDGDPGYVSWDDSAALITVSGRVYNENTTTPYSQCDDGGTNNITLYVDGVLFGSVSCASATGAYSFSNVAYGANDTLTVYINGEAEDGVTVTEDPVSNINGLDIYVDHVVLRHENTNSLTIADMEVWDSDDDADIPFDAETGSPDTLTVDADVKLLVWSNKEFEPGGNITTGGGSGDAIDGSIELADGATLTLGNGEAHSVGGNLEMGSGSTLTPAQSTVTFTSSGSGRTIDTNESGFYNLVLNGSGSYSSGDSALTIANDLTLTSGAFTLPAATTTISGSLTTTGGSFDANGGTVVFAGTGSETVTTAGSDFNELLFTGAGSFALNDTTATATASVLIESGSVTLPSGSLTVGGDFRNLGGTVTHNTSELIMRSGTGGLLLASSSDLYSITIAGVGAFSMEDEDLTLLDALSIDAGTLTLASGTLTIGGSFDATGGAFDHATGSVLFNSSDTGETINPGVSSFYTVQIGAPTGGYTLTGNATTTNNFNLVNAANFTAQTGTTLYVGNVFQNLVSGTNTTWLGSTLVLDGENAQTINSKATAGDQYDTLSIGQNSDIRMWNSAATTTSIDSSSSLYSKDNAGVDGSLYIYGDFHIDTMTEYWSYATDFDGASLSGGSERAVSVLHSADASTTVDGGVLNLVGTSGNETMVSNQGAGSYAFTVSAGTLNAQYYAYRNLDADGLQLSGTPTITSLDHGDFELAVDTGTLITLSSTTLNANASKVLTGNRFATTTAISGSNITLTGTTPSAWTFSGHTGNLAGEDYDVDGATECGSVRWNDSSCLLTQQTHYRWRADDGGLGVPASEWFDTDWDARKRVRIENSDNITYTDAVVELTVAYDSDMQADFDDLRFTDSSGTTTIQHWFGSTTDSTAAEVWVKVPSVPANETATVFMYYNNPTALSSSSAADTFIAADDFEDNDIAEYSGETGEFVVNTNTPYDGDYGLDVVDFQGKTDAGGIYRLDEVVSQGETIQFQVYIDSTGTGDEICTMFGIQSTGAPADNYGVCLEQAGNDRIVLVKDVIFDDASGTFIASSSVSSWETGWYEVEVDWQADGDMNVTLSKDGSTVTTFSGNDTDYTDGGIGFTFWFQKGGWDSYHSRPTLTTEPTVRFGAEQGDGGATWLSDLDTAYTGANIGDTVRLRLLVENSGLSITDQEFLLEYAEKGGAPSCEAVGAASFASVPAQASCTGSPVCMQSSSNVTNGASTVDLLAEAAGDYSLGEAREDPSNITSTLDLDQDSYTELEYVITPSVDVNDQNLCFRVTDNGADYDTYLKVAALSIRFDPSVDTVYFNGQETITLLGGTTTRVYATSTVSDANGYADLSLATSTFYTTTATAACTSDNNDCYISTNASTTGQCSFTNCSGDECVLECYADMFFHADSTDGDGIGGDQWFAFLEVEDIVGGVGFNSSMGVELGSLQALNVDSTINYGTLAPNANTGATNATNTVANIGNVPIDVSIEATDLSDGQSSTIPGEQQKFATSTFTYNACVFCATASTTTPIPLEVDLSKPTSDTPPVEDEVYWGIAIPIGTNSAAHTGLNIFYAANE